MESLTTGPLLTDLLPIDPLVAYYSGFIHLVTIDEDFYTDGMENLYLAGQYIDKSDERYRAVVKAAQRFNAERYKRNRRGCIPESR